MFSLVLVPDRFHRNAYALAYESLKHKKTPNLSNEPVLCLHTTDNLAKNQIICSISAKDNSLKDIKQCFCTKHISDSRKQHK